MSSKHEKRYEDEGMNIPMSIYKDKTVRGECKMILTLLKKFTHNGKRTSEALTGEISRILHTREDSIKTNLKYLHKQGHIEIFKDPTSKTNYSIRYLYKEKALPKTNGPVGNPIF